MEETIKSLDIKVESKSKSGRKDANRALKKADMSNYEIYVFERYSATNASDLLGLPTGSWLVTFGRDYAINNDWDKDQYFKARFLATSVWEISHGVTNFKELPYIDEDKMTEIRDHAIAYNVEHRGPAGADWNIPFPGLTRKFWGEVQTPVLLKLFIPSMSCYFIGLLVFNPNHDELSIKLHGSVFRTKPL